VARILVVGDIHGDYTQLAGMVAQEAAQGEIAAIFSVGDAHAVRDESDAAGMVGPERHRRIGEFPLVTQGLLDLGAPLYFIGGNHEPWVALDAAGPGWWVAARAYYLGRCGATTIGGLRVAFLSGIYSSRVTDISKGQRTTGRERSYYLRGELTALVAQSESLGQIDLLLTHDWPSGLPGEKPGTGRPELRDLCARLRPRWYCCGHMHRRADHTIGVTQVTCLPAVRSGPISVFDLPLG
jgi:lariat debranching enzyme